MKFVTNGAASPTSSPQQRLQEDRGDERGENAADDRPAGDRERGELEAAQLDVGLEALPPALALDRALCAVSASIAATSARRSRDSSSLGTVTYCDMRRRSERFRTSIAERIAKARSAQTERTTKIISQGEVMTLVDPSLVEGSLRREVEGWRRVRRRRGREAGATARHRCLHVRRQQRAIRHDVLVRELLADGREDGRELLRRRALDIRAVRRLGDGAQRLGVVLGRLQADGDDPDARVVERLDGLLARCLDASAMAVGEKHGRRSLVPCLLRHVRGLDQGVVDARAFDRRRGLGDGGRELVRVGRELGEDA